MTKKGRRYETAIQTALIQKSKCRKALDGDQTRYGREACNCFDLWRGDGSSALRTASSVRDCCSWEESGPDDFQKCPKNKYKSCSFALTSCGRPDSYNSNKQSNKGKKEFRHRGCAVTKCRA